MRPFTHHKHAIAALLLLGSIVPLGAALVSQYGFGLRPCEMCIWQRVPYALVILLGLWALIRPHARLLILRCGMLLWLIDAIIAAYHTAIEQGWVESATGCTAGTPGDGSLESLRAAILQSPLVSCADPAFMFIGLSMASWNMITALALAATGYILLSQQRNIHG